MKITLHLTIHKRNHTGAEPFICHLCDIGFTSSGNILKHKQVHTVPTPYKCELCEKRFTKSSTLANILNLMNVCDIFL